MTVTVTVNKGWLADLEATCRELLAENPSRTSGLWAVLADLLGDGRTCATCTSFEGDAEFCRAHSYWDPDVVGRAVTFYVTDSTPASGEYEERD